ncbi:MAG TPA: DUF2254 family protein [Myxococcota bacterium]|jgi:hypothetical protein|nr:DUF2254 family protein [Myxococcota bacterium]
MARNPKQASWLLPLVILAGGAALFFVVPHAIDIFIDFGGEHRKLWDLITNPDLGAAEGAVGNLSQVISQVLGIAITVVSIIVQLAATRYTPRITELFFKDPVNFVVTGFFVLATVQSQWVALTFGKTYVPRVGIAVAMFSLAVSLIVIVPYFVYVFNFLDPKNVIARIRRHATEELRRCAEGGRAAPVKVQAEIVDALEQLADVALNSIEQKDKIIAMAAVDALREFGVSYLELKPRLPATLFEMPPLLRNNPDFVSLNEEAVQTFVARKTWPEMKLFRQYQMIYNDSLNRMRDLNYLVAINSRLVAGAAIRIGDEHSIRLSVRYFNTYMRATVNAHDVRTAYNVLNQYRLLGEDLLAADREKELLEVAEHIKYYGQLAFQQGLSFITVTAAYDLCALNEAAYSRRARCSTALLESFLLLDKESETEVQEQSLRGIRKAQIKLATYFLMVGDEELARRIWKDMHSEPRERLRSIHQELSRVESREFWEIIDRGTNFDYLEPERKAKLDVFFTWFEESPPAAAAS